MHHWKIFIHIAQVIFPKLTCCITHFFQCRSKGRGGLRHPDRLTSLSDSKHEVFSSVCLRSSQRELLVNDCTEVEFKALSEEEIAYYVDRYKPFDKAGAYGIQEWLGLIAVTALHGSYFNVMGFPTAKFYEALKTFGFFNLSQ